MNVTALLIVAVGGSAADQALYCRGDALCVVRACGCGEDGVIMVAALT